jgi:hypothetical protein
MVKEKQFWNEQYAFECFLMFNSAFEVYLPSIIWSVIPLHLSTPCAA